jgi:hypothetical protein
MRSGFLLLSFGTDKDGLTMTQIATNPQFPYGTFSVDASARDLYTKARLSQSYPLPDVLPMHHPVLQQLEGVYPMVDTLPPWWTHWASRSDPILKPLLQAVTMREWRLGVLNQERWRSWKRDMSPQELEHFQLTSTGNRLLHSPKLIAALTTYDQKVWFEKRGPKDTPQDLDLIISFRLEYLLNMSNGCGWTSCQHLYEGSYNERLPGNWYDTGVAVAMVVPRGADIWQGVEREKDGVILARTTLRVFIEHNNTPVVVICRPYDNNKTLLSLLLSRLVTLFRDHGLSWGTMPDSSLTDLLETGFIGNYQRVPRGEERDLQSVAFWMPPDFDLPYVDGDFELDKIDPDLTFLKARIHRWHS